MSASFVTTGLRRIYSRALSHTASPIDDRALQQSAIIFAPHQDDETLGCGGTIIKKRRAGAEVYIVFMTDGRTSHSHLMSTEELRSIRASEALSASEKLGVPPDHVIMLGFEDGKLLDAQDAAVRDVTTLLRRIVPDQVFIPYYNEPPLDHVATYNTVVAALQTCPQQTMVYEYPIWFWQHWPWVSMSLKQGHDRRRIVKYSLLTAFGLRVFVDFRCSMYVGDVLDLKRIALNEHKSQMSRLLPDPGWLTLADVSDGAFLDCFFQDYEVFRQYSIKGHA